MTSIFFKLAHMFVYLLAEALLQVSRHVEDQLVNLVLSCRINVSLTQFLFSFLILSLKMFGASVNNFVECIIY